MGSLFLSHTLSLFPLSLSLPVPFMSLTFAVYPNRLPGLGYGQTATVGELDLLEGCYLAFSWLWPNTWQKQLEEGRVYFGLWLQRVQPSRTGSVVSGCMVRQNTMVERSS